MTSMSGAVSGSVVADIVLLADEAGVPNIREDAAALAQRLAEGRFYVVCLGQFKRGKSTLLNALVESPVLPTGVVPVTSVITVVRYGENRSARVRTDESGWREIAPEVLRDYVSEEQNPGNAKRVTGVEVFEPSPLLRRGLCLVDTPGVGSVFAENTTATREFLPQVDAALVLLGADPPITAEELSLVREVAPRVPHCIFLLAKADRTSELERREAGGFTRRVLADRLGGDVGPILEVSAREVLAGEVPTRDWGKLVQALDALASRAGADLVAGADQRGTSDLADRLVAALEEQLAAIERPTSETEARVDAFRRGASRAEQAIDDLAPLFAAEGKRLFEALERAHDAFFREVRPQAEAELDAALRLVGDRGPELRRRALDEAVAVARRCLAAWRTRKTDEIDRLFREAMQRFVRLLGEVENALRAADPTACLPALTLEPALRAPSRFYMTELLAAAPTSLGRRLLDIVGFAFEGRNEAIREQTRDYLRRLIEVNSERIKNDLRDRVDTSRRELETDAKSRLREATATAERLLANARDIHAAGSAAVASERERLSRLLAQARGIKGRCAVARDGAQVAVS